MNHVEKWREKTVRVKDIKIHDTLRATKPNLDGLKSSISRFGIINPVIVDKNNNLIDGSCRLAALSNGRRSRKIKVIELDLNGYDRYLYSLITFIHRNDLNPIEKARAYKNIMRMNDIDSIRKLARFLNISKTGIEFHIKLLDLPQDMQDRIASGEIKPYSLQNYIYKQRVKKVADFEKMTDVSLKRSFSSRLLYLTVLASRIDFSDEKYRKVALNILNVILTKVNGWK